MNLYTHTQDRIDQIIARNLENVAPASPAIVHHICIKDGDNWTVEFYGDTPTSYDVFLKQFDGRKWS